MLECASLLVDTQGMHEVGTWALGPVDGNPARSGALSKSLLHGLQSEEHIPTCPCMASFPAGSTTWCRIVERGSLRIRNSPERTPSTTSVSNCAVELAGRTLAGLAFGACYSVQWPARSHRAIRNTFRSTTQSPAWRDRQVQYRTQCLYVVGRRVGVLSIFLRTRDETLLLRSTALDRMWRG